jgi:CTP:molybdopterin cytidylyltransferase MocA
MPDVPRPRPLCIVLAAGLGTRMGVPKALMSIRGVPWWEMQESKLHAAGVEALWVVGPLVAARFREVENAPWHTTASAGKTPLPMFASVAHALTVCRPRALNFILPVDVPCPAPLTFARLAASCGEGAAVPARGDQTGHPLCLSGAWMNRHLCTQPPPDPATSRLDAMTRLIVCRVPVDDPDVLCNLNTPHALEQWIANLTS